MLSRMNMAKAVGAWAVTLALFAAGSVMADGDCASCTSTRCQSHHCPPALKHCAEGAPRICVRLGCPKPICNPCNQPNWGYYETCWRPWPWPADYSHCAVVPPAATIALSQHPYENVYNPYQPGMGPGTGSGYVPGSAPGGGAYPMAPSYSAQPLAPMPPLVPIPSPGPGPGPSTTAPNFAPPNFNPPASSGPPPGVEFTPAPRESRPGL